MELVIKLSDKEYSDLQSASYHSFDKYTAYLAMKNGTPLTKHHGRLIDADAFQKYCFNKNFDKRLSEGGLTTINMFLEFQPTIVEGSDKE